MDVHIDYAGRVEKMREAMKSRGIDLLLGTLATRAGEKCRLTLFELIQYARIRAGLSTVICRISSFDTPTDSRDGTTKFVRRQ